MPEIFQLRPVEEQKSGSNSRVRSVIDDGLAPILPIDGSQQPGECSHKARRGRISQDEKKKKEIK